MFQNLRSIYIILIYIRRVSFFNYNITVKTKSKACSARNISQVNVSMSLMIFMRVNALVDTSFANTPAIYASKRN